MLHGERQAANVPGPCGPSRRHSRVAAGSLGAKVNVGALSLVGPDGPPVIAVVGAAVSISKVCEAGTELTLPAASRARTSKVCRPSGSAAAAYGDSQAAKSAWSRRQSKP